MWSLASLGLVEWTYRARHRMGWAPGGVVAFAVVMDAVGRVVIEPLRGGAQVLWLGMNPWQAIAACTALGAGAVLVAKASGPRIPHQTC
jgi:hypothetical protein